MSTNIILIFYYSFQYKILTDFYSQGGFTLSICSQVKDDSEEKMFTLIYQA